LNEQETFRFVLALLGHTGHHTTLIIAKADQFGKYRSPSNNLRWHLGRLSPSATDDRVYCGLREIFFLEGPYFANGRDNKDHQKVVP
jgi:hypothetical protein